ncbi:hypothetical protein KAR91_69860 [Candidatus Pacearchaeota archaeon]|nr:hypothetical protein [Candidatus Pacearchaeota archaeon]
MKRPDVSEAVTASQLSPAERRAWVEEHDEGYTQSLENMGTEHVNCHLIYPLSGKPKEYGRGLKI